MINIQLTEINKDKLYAIVLQTTEEVCEEYHLDNEFGTISMANQMVIDYLNNNFLDYMVNVDLNLDNDSLYYSYSSSIPLFRELSDSHQVIKDEYHLLSLLADENEFSIDGKQLSLTFHVKPHIRPNHILHLQSSLHKTIS